MPAALVMTTVADLIEHLEKEIAAGRNPTTPEQWQECIIRLIEEKKKAQVIAVLKDNE